MGSAFKGDPVVPVIRRWVRTRCEFSQGSWCSLLELRRSYESYCRQLNMPEHYVRHDILPTLARMGLQVQYGEEPGVYGLVIKEV